MVSVSVCVCVCVCVCGRERERFHCVACTVPRDVYTLVGGGRPQPSLGNLTTTKLRLHYHLSKRCAEMLYLMQFCSILAKG